MGNRGLFFFPFCSFCLCPLLRGYPNSIDDRSHKADNISVYLGYREGDTGIAACA